MANFFRIAVFLTAAMFFAGPVSAESPPEGRKFFIDRILTTLPAKKVATQRWVCMKGAETGGDPGIVAGELSEGGDFPDVTDLCVAALIRSARDHTLPDLYKELRTTLGVSTDGYETMPMQIGAVALKNGTELDLGGGRAVDIWPSMAFDAGFTVAYQNGAPEQQNVNEARLKEVTESCLRKGQNPQTCYAVGLVYGARAYKADMGH